MVAWFATHAFAIVVAGGIAWLIVSFVPEEKV